MRVLLKIQNVAAKIGHCCLLCLRTYGERDHDSLAIFALLPRTMLYLILDSMLYCRRPTQAALHPATLLQQDLNTSVICSIVFRGAAVFSIQYFLVKLGS